MSDQKIYLLLTDTGSMLTRTIKLFSKKKYNHVSLAFDAGLIETFSFGRKKANNPFIGGFIREDITSDFYSQAKCAVFALSVTEEQAANMRGYVSCFENEKDKYHYNFLGLVTAFFEKEWDRENYYFCSHFVATILEKGKVLQSPKPVTLMAPEDVLESLPFIPLYEGDLYHFNELFMEKAQKDSLHDVEVVFESFGLTEDDLFFPEELLSFPTQ